MKERVGKANCIARALFSGAFSLELALHLHRVPCNRLNLLTLSILQNAFAEAMMGEWQGFFFSGNEDYGLQKLRKKERGSFRMTG